MTRSDELVALASAGPRHAASKRGRSTRALVAVAVVVVGVAAGAATYVVRGHHQPSPRTIKPASARLVPFVDRADGVAVGIPTHWTRLDSRSAGAALLAASPDRRASMLLRSVRLAHRVNPDNAAAVNDVVATVIDTSKVRVLAHDPVDAGGMRGVVYVYTFATGSSADQSLHWHYFLFDGRRLQMLVLQATPATAYRSLAGTFESIANSVHPV